MKKVYRVSAFITLLLAAAAVLQQGCKNKQGSKEPPVQTGFVFREKLSDYGFFTGELKALQPAAGVTHYEIITPLFSDYTVKDRFIVLPKGKPLKYTASGVLDFPDASIIIKNFAYKNKAGRKVMIETRLLVKDPADGQWKVMDYLWNQEQTEAVKHITGAALPIAFIDDAGNEIHTTYLVPNLNDCKRCHNNNNELQPIGPKARNLNFILKGQKENQLVHWAAKGMLTGMPVADSIGQLPDWTDAQRYTLDQRARAYLEMNCAHCHLATGDASNTGLFLDYDKKDPYHVGVMKEPVSAGGGAGGLNYDIVPGDPAHSIFVYRMNSAEPNIAMPELGRSVIHKEGVALITEWIKKMK
ncbi:MAG TPA: SO2930 family diheme c-type cytochrome [Niabella sp.]